VQYGHKLNLVTPQGLILDVVVEAGNPADRAFYQLLGAPDAPVRRAAATGRRRWRHASQDNLTAAKTRGVKDLSPSTRSAPGGRKTWSRAAGSIASCATSAPGSRPAFSCLKRAYGWHAAPGGLDHFQDLIWSAVGAHNLVAARPPQTGIAPAPPVASIVASQIKINLSTPRPPNDSFNLPPLLQRAKPRGRQLPARRSSKPLTNVRYVTTGH